MATRRKVKKLTQQEYIARVIWFLILGLSVFWGTLLTVFSLFNVLQATFFTEVIFDLIFVMIGLIAWLNFYYYVDLSKAKHFIDLWTKWYKKNTDVVKMAVVLTALFEMAVYAAVNNIVTFRESFEPFFAVLALPSIFAEYLMSIVYHGTEVYLHYLPLISWINELGIFVGVAFQLVLFYYISKVLFWAPHHHQKRK